MKIISITRKKKDVFYIFSELNQYILYIEVFVCARARMCMCVREKRGNEKGSEREKGRDLFLHFFTSRLFILDRDQRL